MLAFVTVGLRTPILPLYASEITHVFGLIGLLVAAEGIGTLLADLPIAGLVRKLGPGWGRIIRLTIEAGTTVALKWVDSVAVAIVLPLASGIGFALFGIARPLTLLKPSGLKFAVRPCPYSEEFTGRAC